MCVCVCVRVAGVRGPFYPPRTSSPAVYKTSATGHMLFTSPVLPRNYVLRCSELMSAGESIGLVPVHADLGRGTRSLYITVPPPTLPSQPPAGQVPKSCPDHQVSVFLSHTPHARTSCNPHVGLCPLGEVTLRMQAFGGGQHLLHCSFLLNFSHPVLG